MSTATGQECVNHDGQADEVRPDVIVGGMTGSPERRGSGELLLVVITLPPVHSWTGTMRRVIHWLRCGAPAVWVIDPASRMVSIHQQYRIPLVLEQNDELTGARPFPDLRCRVADLFFVPEQ